MSSLDQLAVRYILPLLLILLVAIFSLEFSDDSRLDLNVSFDKELAGSHSAESADGLHDPSSSYRMVVRTGEKVASLVELDVAQQGAVIYV